MKNNHASDSAKTKAAVKYFYKKVDMLPWYFPKNNLGKYIEDFIPKCQLKSQRLTCNGKIDLSKIDTLEEYVEKLNSTLWFDADIAEAVIDGASFWAGKQAKYSFMEIVLMELSAISFLGCTVLYKRDMEPKYETEIMSTTITTGPYIKPKCIKKR